MSNERLLVVDDDEDLCLLLSRFLNGRGYQVNTAHAGHDGLHQLKEQPHDLVLTDHRLPDMDSLQLLEQVQKLDHSIPVMIMSAYADVRVAVEAMRQGAFHYSSKPIYPDELLSNVRSALRSKPERYQDPGAQLPAMRGPTSAGYIKGSSPAIQLVLRHIDLVAPTGLSVLLSGETGTGKEYTARAIHALSPRAHMPFVAIDCGSLSNDLADSELFGHTKGSFTGALSDRQGSFEEAEGGTLFLDEVGNLSLGNQVKLLRVLQERVIRRIGSETDRVVDVRIIAATNENLERAVSNGKFREDLFHRLNEFGIIVPPLRERREDIALYANCFRALACSQLGRSVSFTNEVMDTFHAYAWPGNLRELFNVVKRSVLFCTGPRMARVHLPPELWNDLAFSHPYVGLTDALQAAAEMAEREAIVAALERAEFHRARAAALLGIDRKTLYNKMKAFGITI